MMTWQTSSEAFHVRSGPAWPSWSSAVLVGSARPSCLVWPRLSGACLRINGARQNSHGQRVRTWAPPPVAFFKLVPNIATLDRQRWNVSLAAFVGPFSRSAAPRPRVDSVSSLRAPFVGVLARLGLRCSVQVGSARPSVLFWPQRQRERERERERERAGFSVLLLRRTASSSCCIIPPEN